MKLRIRGNLLRFRLGRSEVRDFRADGAIEETVKFAPGQNDFQYRLEKTSSDEFSGSFTDGRITVGVPADLVDRWVDSDQVEIEGNQTLDENTTLSFLIEKDFVCLSAHDDEDQSDKYPHPNAGRPC